MCGPLDRQVNCWHTLYYRLRKSGFMIGLLLLINVPTQAQIILTEVMFDPDTLEHHNEFVEIFNVGNQPVNLQGWMIGDSTELDHLLGTGSGLSLASGQFAVILDGSYSGNSTTYDTLIPPAALVLTIDDGAFGQYGWANTVSEPVILVNAAGDTVQLYRYSPGNIPGYSDEKILLNEGNDPESWMNSRVFRGTPGDTNSVFPHSRDLLLDTVRIIPQYPIEEMPFQVRASLKNIGTEAVAEFGIIVFEDENTNQQPDPGEIRADSMLHQMILPGDTMQIALEIDSLPAGEHTLTIRVDFPADQDPANNRKAITFTVEFFRSSVVINEILYRPRVGESEWLELFNAGEQSYNLTGWKIADARDTVEIAPTPVVIASGGYVVLSGDSSVIWYYGLDPQNCVVIKSLPTLNNDTDDLKLFSPAGRLIDRVTYSDSWMRRNVSAGISLERINPAVSSQLADNWTASVDPEGSTPARKNSVFVETVTTDAKIVIHPNPFSPDNDGFEDFTLIQYQIAAQTAFLTADIYDVLGRKVRRLADKLPVGQNGSLIWDGKDDEGNFARIGLYLVLLRVSQSQTDLYQELKATVALIKR